MTEEQKEQFKIEATNQIYQFLANLDQNIINILSTYISQLYCLIEEEKDITCEDDLEGVMSDFYSDLYDDLESQLTVCSNKMINIYEMHREGVTEQQEEKTSFESSNISRSYTNDFFTLSKDDFLDLEKFKTSTKDYKTREDERTAQTNYKVSYKELCPEIDKYNDIIEKYGYNYIISMNKWLIDLFNDAIDTMTESLKENEDVEEIVGTLSDLGMNVFEDHPDIFRELETGVWTDIATNLSNNKEKAHK